MLSLAGTLWVCSRGSRRATLLWPPGDRLFRCLNASGLRLGIAESVIGPASVALLASRASRLYKVGVLQTLVWTPDSALLLRLSVPAMTLLLSFRYAGAYSVSLLASNLSCQGDINQGNSVVT